ncbi:MAG: hypothetical protein IJ752_03845 [Alphaproteobacteria bacterium]|nr:hypothetical protein [Alphaproteobacteria bacterium]
MTTKFSFETRVRCCFAALILVFIFAPLLFRSVPAAYWFHDNFFNTLQIAENFRAKGFPTFDGITPTNDFSLFWGLVLSGLSAVVSSKTVLFLILVRLLLGLALALSLWLLNKLIDALCLEPTKEVRFLAFSALLAQFLYAAFTGSDAAWAIPCIFINALCLLSSLKKPSVLSGIVCGLSVSLCAFVRFDCAAFFLTALLVFYFQFNGKAPVTTKQALKLLPGLIIGLIPLMFYADLLQTKFGSPVPAETLSWGKAQGMAAWRILTVLFFEPLRYAIRIPQATALIPFPTILLALVAYTSFPWLEQEQTPKDTVFYTLIWYPIIYLAAIAIMTFIALPEYAFYPFAVGTPFAFVFAANKINTQIMEKEKNQARLTWLILGVLFVLVAFSLAIKPRSAGYVHIADAVAEFADQHQGRYAMSFGAGFVSSIKDITMTRLDGMAEDLDMLKRIEAQENLNKAFQKYQIDYYVAINPNINKGCYSVREPVQNRFGGTNKGMNDWLCMAPVFEKQITPKLKVVIFKTNKGEKTASEQPKIF